MFERGTDSLKHFKALTRDGFGLIQLKFTNGYVLSMNIGSGGYNENRYDHSNGDCQSNDAEVAVFAPDGKWITREFFPKAEEVSLSVSGWETMESIESAIVEILKRK